jgi:hypothetical protein
MKRKLRQKTVNELKHNELKLKESLKKNSNSLNVMINLVHRILA